MPQGIGDLFQESLLEELTLKADHAASFTGMAIRAALYNGTATNIATGSFATGALPAGGLTEAAGVDYVRQTIAWNAASGTSVTSNGAVTFPEAAAAAYTNSPFQTFAVIDQTPATSENVIALDTTQADLTVNQGDQPQYASGQITISMAQAVDDGFTDQAVQYSLNLLTQQTPSINTGYAATRYVGFTTADPTTAGLYTNEVSGGGYARVALTASSWSAASTTTGTTTITYNALIDFGTTTGSWGGITHWFITDDLSATTDMIAYGPVSGSPKTINNGDDVSIATGQIAISIIQTGV